MKTFIRAGLDLAFGLAWLGLGTLMVAIAGRLLSALFGLGGSEDFFVFLGTVLVPLLVLWIPLTALLAVPWIGVSAERPGAALWRRASLVQTLVVGPTAFYLGSLRPQLSGQALSSPGQWSRPMRATVRALHLAGFGGTLALIAAAVALFALPPSTGTVVAAPAFVILIPICGLSTTLLMTLSLVDSMRRATEEGHGEGFLRMLNPWSGIFGVHLYYRRVLLPDMNREATD